MRAPRTVSVIVAFALLSLLPALASSQIPRVISYQGLLRDASTGAVVPDGQYDIIVSIYEEPTGGSAPWADGYINWPVVNGVFDVYLGGNLPLYIPLDRPYWVGVSIEGSPELEPRVALTSAPYALHASVADTALSGGSTGGGNTLDGAYDQGGPGAGRSIVADAGAVTINTTTPGPRAEGPTIRRMVRDAGDDGPRDYQDGFIVTQDEAGNDGHAIVGVQASPDGTGAAVTGQSYVSGRAGWFEIVASVNGDEALYVSTDGTGHAARVRIDNESNNSEALLVETAGTGKAARFNQTNFGSTIGALTASTDGIGSAGTFAVYGTSGAAYGAFGLHNGSEGAAGLFQVSGTGNTARVIEATNFADGGGGFFSITESSNSSTALYASTDGTGDAGYFNGNVGISDDLEVYGTLYKSAGSFKIDHPLDPEGKFLVHSFVESPDMMNVYNGNVTLDGAGEARVTLPDWFEALNRDFRYQLTCIGAFAPVYVAEKISGNRFRIAGGQAGLEVSWQVTGVRQDKYANAHRIPVEVDKPIEERGYYLHPEAWGQSDSRGIVAQRRAAEGEPRAVQAEKR